MQAVYWVEASVDDMEAHIGAMDDAAEFFLKGDDARSLQAFLLGPAFDPFLEALDPDNTRVQARKKAENDLHDFKALRRDRGARELHRWLGPEDNEPLGEFDADSYADVPDAKVPTKYSEWLEMMAYHEVLRESIHPQTSHELLLSHCLLNLMNYAHNMQYKLDYLLRTSRIPQERVSDSPFEDFMVKHPFLARCDDHVAKVRNSNPTALARTSAVSVRVSICVRFRMCMHVHSFRSTP